MLEQSQQPEKSETKKITPEFLEQVNQEVTQVFTDFNQGVLSARESLDKAKEFEEFMDKYGDIVKAFGELQEKITKWFQYAGENPNLKLEDFTNGIADLKKIFGKLTFIMNEWDHKPGESTVENKEKNGKLHSSTLKAKKERLELGFNFEEDENSEARARMDFSNSEGNRYGLRFDLDKRVNKVECDLRSKALEKLFFHIGIKDGSSGHHFVMHGLSEYVFENDDNKEKVIRFKEIVEKFKTFLVSKETWERGMLEVLIRKFNS